MKISTAVMNIIFGVLLSGLLAPGLLLLPDSIRGGTAAWLLALACIALVFYIQRSTSKR